MVATVLKIRWSNGRLNYQHRGKCILKGTGDDGEDYQKRLILWLLQRSLAVFVFWLDVHGFCSVGRNELCGMNSNSIDILQKTNMTSWKTNHLKMYLLLKMVIFQPLILVFGVAHA